MMIQLMNLKTLTGLHECRVYKGALLTTASYVVVCLQEDGIQASPEYWSQSNINGKTTASTTQHTLL